MHTTRLKPLRHSRNAVSEPSWSSHVGTRRQNKSHPTTGNDHHLVQHWLWILLLAALILMISLNKLHGSRSGLAEGAGSPNTEWYFGQTSLEAGRYLLA